MIPGEIQFFTPTDTGKLETALNDAFKAVMISLPFSAGYYNSKQKSSLIKKQIQNRIPHILFNLFAEERELIIEKQYVQFWQTPIYDFIFHDTAIRIVHQWVNAGSLLPAEKYVTLPALIPNRYESDIWDERNETPSHLKNRSFLFTFTQCNNYLTPEILIKPEILKFYESVEKKYGRWKSADKPFSEQDFWAAFAEIGELPHLSFRHVPTLIIAGIAGENEFSFFADTDAKTHHGYRLYQGQWYQNDPGGGLSFCNGLIKTHIKNATCPMEALPSFLSRMKET